MFMGVMFSRMKIDTNRTQSNMTILDLIRAATIYWYTSITGLDKKTMIIGILRYSLHILDFDDKRKKNHESNKVKHDRQGVCN